MPTLSAVKYLKTNELELIKSCQHGDMTAFNKLVEKYKTNVFNICYRFLGNMHDAEDCAQDIFIKLYYSIHKFKGESLFSTWLYRITINCCINKSNLLNRRSKKISTAMNCVENIKDQSIPVIDSLALKEKAGIIQNEINKLPDECKTVLILRDIQGYSYKDVSKISGCKLGTVKSRLTRARNILKERLKGIVI
ncbi:RNA polymerase sigma factor [bacterium]